MTIARDDGVPSTSHPGCRGDSSWCNRPSEVCTLRKGLFLIVVAVFAIVHNYFATVTIPEASFHTGERLAG